MVIKCPYKNYLAIIFTNVSQKYLSKLHPYSAEIYKIYPAGNKPSGMNAKNNSVISAFLGAKQ